MRLIQLTLAALMLLPMASFAAEFADPKDLLDDVYAHYAKQDWPDLHDYASDSLLALLVADDKRAEPSLDFDPLSNSQDPVGLKVEVGAPGIAGDWASADVKLLSQNGLVINVEFAKQANGWKIDDISAAGDDGWRLSEILAADPLLN